MIDTSVWSDRYDKSFLFYNFGLDIFWIALNFEKSYTALGCSAVGRHAIFYPLDLTRVSLLSDFCLSTVRALPTARIFSGRNSRCAWPPHAAAAAKKCGHPWHPRRPPSGTGNRGCRTGTAARSPPGLPPMRCASPVPSPSPSRQPRLPRSNAKGNPWDEPTRRRPRPAQRRFDIYFWYL